MDFIQEYILSLWHLILEMAPWLLLGFFFAGLLKVFYPQKNLEKHMGKNNLSAVINATLLGIPLPLCSCGVIPTGISFFKNGASRSATNAFLISTPQTGIDSIFATYALIGLPFAIVRPIIAFFTGIIGGITTIFFTQKATNRNPIHNEPAHCNTTPPPLGNKWSQVFHYGFIEMMITISKWLVIGLLLAALISVLIPDNFFEHYIGNFWIELLIVLLISIPLYVCATGSIPIVAILLLKGLSPAAAILFLMAGPATNIATIIVLARIMGLRSLAAYLISIIGGGIAFAILIHFTIPNSIFIDNLPIDLKHSHSFFPPWLTTSMSLILIGLIINSFYLKYFKYTNATNTPSSNNPIQTFTVKGMSCSHCVESIKQNVGNINNVTHIQVDLQKGKVIVTGNAERKAIINSIHTLGFRVLE